MKFVRIGWFLNFVLSLLFFNASHAQVTLSGKVFDENTKEPLIGASVVIDGTTEGTVTDFDGAFALKTQNSLPVKLSVSYVGYEPKIVDVASDEELDIFLGESVITTDVVEVRGQRISDKQKSSPLTVESMDVLAIKETAATSFYDGLGNLKGVDLTAASLGFKVINTRGFNSTSPVRSLQIIDGVDNQAPGLNFSLGNFLGAPELDVRKVDIIQGASSSFYGPNAFNGVISMETKNPFYTEGLSAVVKGGERNLLNTEVRWADSFKDKDGNENIAYKFTLSYLQADDWVADNDQAVDGTPTPTGNPGGWDAVNTYGDEYDLFGDFTQNTTNSFNESAGLLTVHRPGYREEDVVDYDTRNFKALGSVYIRTNPKLQEESPELVLGMSYGWGTTVYQGDNRFSLRNIQFFQPRVEFRKRDNFFIRAYMSRQDAGDSYDPYFTALRLQDRAVRDGAYYNNYKKWWEDNRIAAQMVEMGYPDEQIIFDPETGQVEVIFDSQEAQQWLQDNQEFMNEAHAMAQDFANAPDPANNRPGRFVPGSPEFNEAFNDIRSRYNNEEGGTRFFDRSALYHLHAEKRFDTDFAEIIVGGNGRLYTPNSRGTIFYDSADIRITNYEYGAYAGINKTMDDGRWRTNATFRVDKNENFDYVFSPAASVVWKPRPNHYLRVSFSSGVRNPTLTDQFLSLNVGPAILAGNLNGADSVITLESFQDYLSNFLQRSLLEYYDVDPIRPERVRTLEGGYRATLWNNLFLDAGYYYNIYTDFIGFNIAIDAQFDSPSDFVPSDVQVFRFASNAQETVTTQGFSVGLNYYFADYFSLNGNYSYNAIVSASDDPIIPAFNTPEHKYNIGLSGRNIRMGKIKNWGFNINYKWVEGFLFEGSPQFTGFVPSYGLLDGQVNYNFNDLNTTLKIGASNILNNAVFQTYGGPRVGRLAYISLLYEWKNTK
ncbi:MAG: TonB-dependent receptor [Phaeodactylibacter xiamenensis]|uniref:TonB-dependent receptor n=1 Tax=Phaeodactylibacter xiamenensis TaxID=1524460 RepID=A0A098S2P8_9BACT|nr:TonB-dependent receptor [Phaeodactylibacter xiamenensis]KGE86093.1 TonB-dependent receptor [Phaeodactylibacter xiamenensis]MCR9050433.1 TonB-dependent receptor [bacterium]